MTIDWIAGYGIRLTGCIDLSRWSSQQSVSDEAVPTQDRASGDDCTAGVKPLINGDHAAKEVIM